jgi:hypothetical protein
MIHMGIFAVWDRIRLPGIHSTLILSFCSFLLFSLTYGYIPLSGLNFEFLCPMSYVLCRMYVVCMSYVCRMLYVITPNITPTPPPLLSALDMLFPLSVGIVVFSELSGRYGGVLDVEQYMYFSQCLLCASGGALLRAVDLHRNNTKTKHILLICYALALCSYCLLASFTDDIALCGMVLGAAVLSNPARGHAAWHIASAYTVYLWWYMLRTRPGNPKTPYGVDRVVVFLLLFVALKNAFRRIVMKLPSKLLAPEYHDRVRLTLEHTVFTLWVSL